MTLLAIGAALLTLAQLHAEAESRAKLTTRHQAASIAQTLSSQLDAIAIARRASSGEIGRKFATEDVDKESIGALLAEQGERINLPNGSFSVALRDADLHLRAAYPKPLEVKRPLGEAHLSPGLQQALQANPEEGSYSSAGNGAERINQLLSYHRDATYGVLVEVGIERDRAFADWRRQAWTVGGLVSVNFFSRPLPLQGFERFAMPACLPANS